MTLICAPLPKSGGGALHFNQTFLALEVQNH